MKEVNKLKIFEASSNDYTEVVCLFNKNQAYQFSNGVPLTERDLELTMKIKEVSNLFLLSNGDTVIGTVAFFKFITHGCLDCKSSYSGFLLIDSEHRSGQAITYLYKTILEKITNLGITNLYTEISKYNKPSLSLSKLNGFREYSGTYEDILHCRSLKSNLPKILSTFRISNYRNKEDDLSSFKILEEVENFSKNETEVRAKVSEEDILLKIENEANLPYFLKMNLFQIEIVEEKGSYYLKFKFFSDTVEKVQVKIGKYRFYTLTQKNPSLLLSRRARRLNVQASIITKNGNIDVQLERCKASFYVQETPLVRKFQGYDLFISRVGSLLFKKDGRAIFEDSFLIFSSPVDSLLKVKEVRDEVRVQLSYQGASIHKIIKFIDEEKIECSYRFNQKAKDLFPDLIKQIFKIYPQEYLIKEDGCYRVYIPGIYPVEHDDFIQSDGFKERNFDYYIPSEGKHLQYVPPGPSSNQMQFRPISLIDGKKVDRICYQFTISRLPFIKTKPRVNKDRDNLDLYKPTTRDLLKYLHNVQVEEEKNYGTKRMLINRKKYLNIGLVSCHNQIVIVNNVTSIDSDLYSISFDYRIFGRIEQVRYGEYIHYDNKSYILENYQELMIYDTKEDRYLKFYAPNGVFYSYRENNHLKVRCVFSTKYSHTGDIKIKEYRKK